MNQVSKGNFGEGSVRRHILNQALPLTVAQLVQLLYNIVDRIYIGHMPGDDAGMALTGIGLCFPIITMIAACVNLIATGSAPLCSMARGRQDQKAAAQILQTAYSLLIGIAFMAMALMYLIKKPLLYLLGASDVTFVYANDYMNIYLVGTLFFAMSTGMNTFINLQGYPRIGMLTTLIGAIINLVLDPIFIFACGMGVQGAAIATVISQGIGAAWVLRFLSKKELELRLDILHPTVYTGHLQKMLTLGIPGFIMGFTNCAVQAVCNATLSIHGGDVYVGIMTIINSVREIGGLPINGISSGAQPVLSYNYGAAQNERVKQGIRFSAWTGVIYTAVFWILTLSFPTFFLQLFSGDAQMVTLGKTPLMIYFMGFIFMSLQYAGQSTFVALGKAKQAVFFSIFRKLIIVVPLTLLLPMIPQLGVMGVFLAEPISNLIGGSASFLCMHFTLYRKL